jgi:hypothetical protein
MEAFSAQAATIGCLIAIGFAAGLYIVPLYTLLQHRAPKDSKGNMVATSNFMNVTGGLVAVATFYFVTFVLQAMRGNSIPAGVAAESNDPALLADFVAQIERQQSIPQLLFLVASLITLFMFCIFAWMRPDFLLRAFSFFLLPGRRVLRAVNAGHIPSYGPLLVVSNARTIEQWTNVISVLDRSTRFVWEARKNESSVLAAIAKGTGLGLQLPLAQAGVGANAVPFATRTLANHDLFGVPCYLAPLENESASNWAEFLEAVREWSQRHATEVRILPVGIVESLPTSDEEPLRGVNGEPLVARPALAGDVMAGDAMAEQVRIEQTNQLFPPTVVVGEVLTLATEPGELQARLMALIRKL